MPEPNGKTLTTPKQLAEMNVGLSTVSQWKLRKSGELKFFQIGRRVFYSPEHINDFLKNCEQNVEVDEFNK